MSIVSFELVSLLASIFVIINLRLTKKFILRLLSNIKIYLPFTDKDYEMLIDIKRAKSDKKGIVRSCELDEYIAKSRDDKLSELDVVLFFYICSIFNLIASELKSPITALYNRIFIISSAINQPEQPEEDPLSDYSFNITASFSMITMCYLVYLLLKSIHNNGWKSYDVKIFYLFSVIFFLLFSILQFCCPHFLGIDYEKVVQVVNDRIQKIAIKANPNEAIKVDFSWCTVNYIKIFYSLLFGMFMGLLYQPCMRMSYFDNLLIVTTEKIENVLQNTSDDGDSNSKKNTAGQSLEKLSKIIKLKSILNILILFMMIDPLLKGPLSARNILPHSEISFTLFILSSGIIFEFILGWYCIWYYSFVFHSQNYNDILAFCQKPSKEYLGILREKISYLNRKFWQVLTHIFYLVFAPLLLFIFYINRSGMGGVFVEFIEHGTINSEFKFRVSFMEGVTYVLLLAFVSAKAIYLTGHLFYTQAFKKTANILY